MVNFTNTNISIDGSNSNKNKNENESAFDRLENSQYNKTNMDQMYSFINMIEKKKFQYTLLVTPLLFDERKMSKRNKKIISNNKFILFNSWYTKIKQTAWPVTRIMWDLLKQKHELSDFVFVFDYVEKLGKKVAQRTSSSSSDETLLKKKKKSINSTDITELKENCDLKNKLYSEFYKVLNETFLNDIAPAVSSIYDNTLTQEFLTKSMNVFKTVALKIPISNNVHNTPTTSITGRKRKNSSNTNIPKRSSAVKHRRNTTASNYTMVSDTAEDTNMSE